VSGVPAVFTQSALPERLSGLRLLDIACGQGRASRELARRGAAVLGIDISGSLIEKAKLIEGQEPLGVDFVVADVAQPDRWWDAQPFDGAVCEMALMDIEDLTGTLTSVSKVVRRGGWFVASFVHPCFPGNENNLSSWPPSLDYHAEGWWSSPTHNPEGVRLRAGSYHRTLSTYLNSIIDAGLRLEQVIEPPAPVPTWLILTCSVTGESRLA
jgi:2-polyprenyl-3-methyl-5-hydroxy-6-metoxy-1,4-benzoquinol methylase